MTLLYCARDALLKRALSAPISLVDIVRRPMTRSNLHMGNIVCLEFTSFVMLEKGRVRMCSAQGQSFIIGAGDPPRGAES